MVRLLSFAAFAASLSVVSAVPGTLLFPRLDRGFECGTQTTAEDIKNFEELAALGSYEGNEALKARSRAILTRQAPVYPWGKVTIDTWFHVIAESTNITDGYIPQSQLDAQIAVLNRDFAPHNFAFALKGVTRTINAAWANDLPGAQLASKKALRKGDYATLNIYFLKNLNRGSLGYAYYPRNVPVGSDAFYLDGATNNAFTVPGGTLSPYNLGGTVTHEVGHWMNLAHTFGDPPYSCTTSTDYIADTPAQLGPTGGCPVGRDSCPDQPGLDPINNYMDYSIDLCYTEFTPLQTKRMWDAWFFYRRPRACSADNCLRGLRAATIPGRLQESQAFCSVITDVIVTDAASFPKYAVDACAGNFASRISSACTCLPEPATSSTTTTTRAASSTTTSVVSTTTAP